MRRAIIAAGALAAALVIGACGGNETSGQATGTTMSGGFGDVQSLANAAKQGTVDAKSVKVSMEGSAAGQQMSGDGEAIFDGANTRMAMRMQAAGQTIETRMIGTDVYMKMPSGVPGADPDKPWMKISFDGMPGMADQMERADPTATLEMIVEAGGEITDTKETTVDGQQVTQYSVRLDMAKMAEQMGFPAGAETNETIPMEIYINSDNLPVQIESNMPGMGRTILKYRDWGVPVTIEAPPESEVAEAGDF